MNIYNLMFLPGFEMFDLEAVFQFIIVSSFKIAGIGPSRMRPSKGKLFKQLCETCKGQVQSPLRHEFPESAGGTQLHDVQQSPYFRTFQYTAAETAFLQALSIYNDCTIPIGPGVRVKAQRISR